MTQDLQIKPAVDPANPKFYIDKAEFYKALVDYRKQCEDAAAEGKDRPIVSNYIGSCFLGIAKGLAMKYNFRGYSYIKDMESTAVETCLKNMMSFDPKVSENPFSYFTQVVFYAFLGVIAKEKKQAEIKKKAFMDSGLVHLWDTQDHDNDEFRISLVEYMNSLGKDVEPVKKPKKKPKIALDGLFE